MRNIIHCNNCWINKWLIDVLDDHIDDSQKENDQQDSTPVTENQEEQTHTSEQQQDGQVQKIKFVSYKINFFVCCK